MTPESLLTEPQIALGQRVRDRLRQAAAEFREGLTSTGSEALHFFTIESDHNGAHLHVEFVVLGDQFNVLANGASVHVLLTGSGRGEDVSRWIDESVNLLDTLLRSDLRIRVRPTLFGGNTGAIWIPSERAGNWNGDVAAGRGKGREYVFPHPWYKTVA